MPIEPTRRNSGEHQVGQTRSSGEFVTYAHFSAFMEEFKTFSGGVKDELHEMNERLAEGSTKFALQEQALLAVKKKTDDHSDTIDVLQTEKATREALAAQAIALSRPYNKLGFEIIKTVVIAIVLGACAFIYNIWRDNAIKVATTTTTMSTSVSTPVAPPPAPTHVP